MTQGEKERISLLAEKRAEKDILMNTGIPILFGSKTINLKSLNWKQSNVFEDQFLLIANKLKDIQSEDFKNADLEQILKIILGVLQHDLIEIANAASAGIVTLEYIEEVNASKNDVIEVIIEAFKLNYRYLKNLIALAKGFK